jgi:ubiquinone/menaquinone biosynthesis C-methylase UbiE
MSNIWFRLMAAEFKIRDYLHPRKEIVEEVGLKAGFQVLDYGCGPGGYVLPVAKIIGSSGKLYALDAAPIAIEMVNKIVAKNRLNNVETILSDCDTKLPDGKLNVVLLYDVFHDLEDQKSVLKELHRVLKENGEISFSDHHLKNNEIVSRITEDGLFTVQKKNSNTYTFIKK